MINLFDTYIDVEAAKKTHLEFFKCYVTKRLTGTVDPKCKFSTDFPNRRQSSKSARFQDFVNFIQLNDNLEQILIGTPIELINMHDELVILFDSIYGVNSYDLYMGTKLGNRASLGDRHKFFEDIKAVFNYDWFNKLEPEEDYNAYELTKNLGIRSCVFCNRTYTITRRSKSKGKLMRPQLDHWYPESKYPLLAVSFQNLIPCCTYCNSSIKGVIELDPLVHIHPYILETIPDQFSFGYYINEDINEYVIYINKPSTASGKAFATMRKLKVDQMYNAHIPELEDLIKIKKAYSKTYIEEMAKFFPTTGLSEEETYRILFGVELDEKSFHLRPLSKFKSDILKDLGIIK